MTPGPATFLVATALSVSGTPTAVATGDLNGDGKLDLIVLNSSTGKLSVMLGKGDGTFAAPADYAVGNQPVSIIVADLNGDGKLDVGVVNQGDGTISVLLGNGDGTLQTQAVYGAVPGANYLAVGDFNGDGRSDLAVSSATAQTIGILLNNGNGSFAKVTPFVTGSSPAALATGDFDGDGNQDVASANADGTVSVLLGRGDGSFRSLAVVPVGTAPLASIVAGDFNNDGKTDLAVTQSGTKLVTVLLSNGSGSFTKGSTYNVGNNPAQIIVADVNGDKIPDFITANQAANTFSVLLGNGDGTFQSSIDFAVGRSPQALAAGDFDGDGRTDLAVANFVDKSVSVPLGNGDGTFKAARVYGADLARKAIAVGDLDGDGKPDLVVTNFCGADAACAGNGTVSVLLSNADGSYRAAGSYPLGVGPVSAALADLNGDKKLDLIAVNKGDRTVTVLLGNGDGTFQSALTYSLQDSPEALAVGDFNGDGKIDLAVAGDCGSNACVRPGELTMMLGGGDGSFLPGASYSVGYGPVSIAAGDINGDGILDLVVANACGDDSSCKTKGTATVLLGKGQGAFQPGTEISLGMSPSSVALGDLAGRKVLDLTVAYRGDNKVAVLSGNGDGSFKTSVTYAAGTAPSSVVVADFNGDSKADVAVANFKDATVSVLFGNGDGTLQTAVTYPVGAGPESLVTVQAAQSAPVDLVAANGNSGSTPMGSDVTVLKNLASAGPALLEPVFTNLIQNPMITYGDSKVTLTGTLCVMDGPCVPMGDTVTVTINGNTQSTMIADETGDFSIDYDTTGLEAGSYTIDYHYDGDSNFGPADDQSTTLTVSPAQPVFSNLTMSQTITYGTPTISLSGTLCAPNNVCPPMNEVVHITIGSEHQDVSISDNMGHFSTSTFPTGALQVQGSPYTIDYHYDGGSNFKLADDQSTTLTVNPAQPVFSGLTMSQTITYGTPTISLSGTLCAANNLCPPMNEVVHITIGSEHQDVLISDNMGHFSTSTFPTGALQVQGSPYTIDYHYDGDSNFKLADDQSTTLTVNQSTLTITAKDQTKIYGKTFTFNGTEFTVTGMLFNGDKVTSVTLTSAGSVGTAQVGTYPIAPSNAQGTGLGNYSITYANGTMKVTAAPLSITAKDESKIYGQTFNLDGSFGAGQFTVSGLQNNDSVTSVTLVSAGAPSTAHVSGSPYPIVPSNAMGTGLSNYSITYNDGQLTVNPATPTFSNLTASQAIIQGLNSITLSGTICAGNGPCPPQNESVIVTIMGQPSQMTKITDNKGSFSLTYPVAAIAAGMYSITYSYNTDTDFVSASNAGTAVTVQDFTWTSAPTFIIVTQSYNNTNDPYNPQPTIVATANPLQGFAGSIALGCTVQPLQGQSGTPPTCTLTPTGLTGGTGTTSVAIATAANTPVGDYDVVISASTPRSDQTMLTHVTHLTVNVGALAANGPVAPSQSYTVPVSFGGTGDVTFTCVTMTGPSGAQDCLTNQYHVTVVLTPTTGTLPSSVTVTISVPVISARALTPGGGIFAAFSLGMPGIVLLGSLRFGRLSRKRFLQLLGMMIVMVALLQAIGCGGGFTRPAANAPNGQYNILIEGKDSNGVLQTSAVVPFTVFGSGS